MLMNLLYHLGLQDDRQITKQVGAAEFACRGSFQRAQEVQVPKSGVLAKYHVNKFLYIEIQIHHYVGKWTHCARYSVESHDEGTDLEKSGAPQPIPNLLPTATGTSWTLACRCCCSLLRNTVCSYCTIRHYFFVIGLGPQEGLQFCCCLTALPMRYA